MTASSLTLVTGFWDPATLGRAGRRTAEEYLQRFETLHQHVPWPIVAWVDPAWANAVAAIVSGDAPGPRRIIPRAFEDLPLAAEHGAIEALPPFENHDPGKDTAAFSIVTWSKPDLVVDAIGLEGPASSRWAWIDFGIAHVADLDGVDWRAIADAAPDRVRLCTMRATAPAEVADLGEFYRWNRGKVAGGFFTGAAGAMRDLRERVHEAIGRMRAAGRRVHDEQLLAALAAHEPDAFERWYADYAGIVRNYVTIRRDVPTILDGLAYCRERGLSASGVDVAGRLLDAMRDGAVSLTPPEVARLLHEAFICAWYEDRPLAERLGQILCTLYHHGADEFRRTVDGWRPLVEQNLRHAGVDLGRPAWSLDDLQAQPDVRCWRGALAVNASRRSPGGAR